MFVWKTRFSQFPNFFNHICLLVINKFRRKRSLRGRFVNFSAGVFIIINHYAIINILFFLFWLRCHFDATWGFIFFYFITFGNNVFAQNFIALTDARSCKLNGYFFIIYRHKWNMGINSPNIGFFLRVDAETPNFCFIIRGDSCKNNGKNQKDCENAANRKNFFHFYKS